MVLKRIYFKTVATKMLSELDLIIYVIPWTLIKDRVHILAWCLGGGSSAL